MAISDELSKNAQKESALALHRAGQLDRAREEYNKLLAAAPEDADLLGLLGVVALQQEHAEAAEELLWRALRAPNPDPRIHLRNANNLLALLYGQGREDAVRALAEVELPDWPAGIAPNAAERGRVMALADMLGVCGHPERGVRLLESVLAYPGADSAMLGLAGRLQLACGDPQAALPLLEQAHTQDPGDWQPLAAMSIAHDRLGQVGAAREAAQRCGQAGRVYMAPKRDGQRATVLVLNRIPLRIESAESGLQRVHFSKNYISQVSGLMAKEFHFISVLVDAEGPPPELPEIDVVFNNLASGERMSRSGELERAEEFIARIGRPVINPPRSVIEMTRQRVAARLDGIPGLHIPRIERYWRDMARFDEIEADIAFNFSYPVIVRHVAADMSWKPGRTKVPTAILIEDPDALRRFLERVEWPQFYVIQYVNLRKADGNCRKIRAAFFGDEIILSRCQYDTNWTVGSRLGTEFYAKYPYLVTEMYRILREPEIELGPQLMPVLQEIRKRIPLDLFGMDFDVDDEGRVVCFEVQSTMIFFPDHETPDYRIAPTEPFDRLNDAFRRMILEKSGRAV